MCLLSLTRGRGSGSTQLTIILFIDLENYLAPGMAEKLNALPVLLDADVASSVEGGPIGGGKAFFAESIS